MGDLSFIALVLDIHPVCIGGRPVFIRGSMVHVYVHACNHNRLIHSYIACRNFSIHMYNVHVGKAEHL